MKFTTPLTGLLSNKGVLFNVYLLIAIIGLFSLIIASATAMQYVYQNQIATDAREYHQVSIKNLEEIIDQTSITQFWFKLPDQHRSAYSLSSARKLAGQKEVIDDLLYVLDSRAEIIERLETAFHKDEFSNPLQRFMQKKHELKENIMSIVERNEITPESIDRMLFPLLQVSQQLLLLHQGVYSEKRKKLQTSSKDSAETIISLIVALLAAGLIVVSRILKQIRAALKRQKATEEEIRELNLVLEDRVEQRAQELKHSFDQLHQTQDKLVESEKMAALGGLVAGIAHEINTPLGVCATANSYLIQRVKHYTGNYDVANLTRTDFASLIATLDESTHFIQTNLERASGLIRSFKQVAVDRSNDEVRKFNLHSYLSEIILSLEPEIKKLKPDIAINCDRFLDITSHPGAIAQIITNLVMNSLIHGFEDRNVKNPRIEISVTPESEYINLHYSDNGKGASPEQLKKIFDPFFTTRRNHGGSGLGLHIVYNLVSQTLGGSIDCHSTPGEGIKFRIKIPGLIT